MMVSACGCRDLLNSGPMLGDPRIYFGLRGSAAPWSEESVAFKAARHWQLLENDIIVLFDIEFLVCYPIMSCNVLCYIKTWTSSRRLRSYAYSFLCFGMSRSNLQHTGHRAGTIAALARGPFKKPRRLL